MKRIAVLALIVGTLFIAAPAQADEPACAVQPLVAGECVTQPVADYVLGQIDIIAIQQQQLAIFADALRNEQAAHQEMWMLLTSAREQISSLVTKVVRKDATIQRLRAKIRNLQSQ